MNHFPYPGLRPFERDESDIFFGREEQIDELITCVGNKHFLAVVGPSGCGKSSLVHTGLLSGLESGFLATASGNWRIATMRPGNRPFTNLAEALLAESVLGKDYQAYFTDHAEAVAFLQASLCRGSFSIHEILQDTPFPKDTHLLLVVDQFEEIFRYYQQYDKNEATEFIKLLLESIKHDAVYIVITMRSDFLGDCDKFYGLPEAINTSLFLTPRLTRNQLRDVIELPARMFDGQVDSALVNHLLNELARDSDQLPQLQHALMRMWEIAKKEDKENNTTLTLRHYEKIGGLGDALSIHADEAYNELNPEQQKIAKILFCNLAIRDTSRRDTRSPVKLSVIAELANVSWQQVIDVINIFRQEGRNFLTPSPNVLLTFNSVLDISHECLIWQWQSLRKWLQKEIDSADMYRRLEDSAYRWSKKRAELLTGVDLGIVLKWYEYEKPTVLWAKRYGQKEGKFFDLTIRFLKVSEEQYKEKQKQKEAERRYKLQRAEKKRQRKLQRARKQAIFASIGLLVTTALAIWAFLERDNAVSARQKAEIAQNEAESSQQRAESAQQKSEWTEKKRTVDLFESQLTHATLLAKGENYARAREILKQTNELSPKIHEKRLQARNSLAWFTKLMGSTSQPIYQLNNPLFSIALSSDIHFLAAAGEKGTLALFDANKHQLLQYLKGHTEDISTVVFHPQGKWLASAGDDQQIILWSLDKRKPLRKWRTSKSVWALAVNPDGTILASGGDDNKITLWNPETGQSLNTFTGHDGAIPSLAFSPNGEMLASAAYDNTVRLWEVNTGKTLHSLTGHTGHVQHVIFSPDAKTLATSSSDKSIRLWNIKSGKVLHVLYGHGNMVFGASFIDGGRSLISVSDDRTLRVWNTQTGTILRVLQGHTAGVTDIATFGERIFSASSDGSIRLWDTKLPYQHTVDLQSEPASVAIFPQGNKVAVGFASGALHLYSLSKKHGIKKDGAWWQKQAHTKKVKRIAFSPNGNWLVSVSFDNTAKLWQVTSSEEKLNLDEKHTFSHDGAINDVVFSPDNHTFATASFDGRVGLFTVDKQEQFYQPFDGKDVNSVSFNKDGTQLLTTGDYEVSLWAINNGSPTLLQEYPAASDILMWSRFSPNDEQIASVGREQVVHIYSTKNKSTRYRLAGHESTIYRVIFSDDGQRVATISSDATLRFWDLFNGSELFTLRLPAKASDPVPAWDFDFRCTFQNCWIAVPLTRGKLMLYNMGQIEEQAEGAGIVAVTNKEQFIPIPIYRTGSYAESGSAIFGGFMDYMAMLNEKDKGIGGITLKWEECETAYKADRAMECYEKLKHRGHTGAAMFNFLNTDATYAAIERADKDKVPVVSIGYGRSDTVDGSVFPYVFPLLITYWNQSSAMVKFMGEQEGGMDKLKGKTIANVYHHSEFGKETISILDKQAEKYGFVVKYFPIFHPGRDQKLTWEQIKRLNPDWILLRGWGEMNSVALEEAHRINYPIAHIVGTWWTGSEQDVKLAGDKAKGFIMGSFHSEGKEFKVIEDVRQHVYAKEERTVDESIIGSMNYNRGIIHGILNTEAIRTAQTKYGNKPLTGEQVRWGLENLNITEERLKELGATGLFSPIKTSCADHEGGGKVKFQQWDGEKWNIISDWIAPDYELTRPMAQASAQKYADEKGITPRNCSKE
jgi:WD40 repeat protein/ABC-type branched-subunit amino acid transport system substrate-binding protein